jgi:hypothetical protein
VWWWWIQAVVIMIFIATTGHRVRDAQSVKRRCAASPDGRATAGAPEEPLRRIRRESAQETIFVSRMLLSVVLCSGVKLLVQLWLLAAYLSVAMASAAPLLPCASLEC